jgi:flagellar biosynthesis chaperone FliJ
MARLDSLIKLRQHELDQLRQELGVLRAKEAEAEAYKLKLEQQLVTEKELARQDAQSLAQWPVFQKRFAEKIDQAELVIKGLQADVQFKLDEIQVGFQEVKKLELTQEQRDLADKQKRDKKEADQLDEAGLNGFMRQNDEKR